MRAFVTTLAACVGFALLVACGGGAVNENTAPSNTKTSTNAAPYNASTTATPASTTASTGDKIGVAECDEYISKYETCLKAKVPEAGRAAMQGAFDTARRTWRDAAATPAGRAGLAQACKAATDAARTSMKAYGCDF